MIIRENFFAARAFTDLSDLNRQADAWCLGTADDRPCPQDKAFTVRETFVKEQPRLLALPDNPYPLDERKAVRVGNIPYVPERLVGAAHAGAQNAHRGGRPGSSPGA